MMTRRPFLIFVSRNWTLGELWAPSDAARPTAATSTTRIAPRMTRFIDSLHGAGRRDAPTHNRTSPCRNRFPGYSTRVRIDQILSERGNRQLGKAMVDFAQTREDSPHNRRRWGDGNR